MWVKKFGSVFVTLALAITVVAVLSGPAEAAGKKCRNIAHRAMFEGTENQARGVRENARWGFTEIDARMTKDGKVVALHDFSMARATGGKVKKPVGSFTLRQLRNMKFTLGHRVETTRRLIRIAGREGSPIMVTINSYKRYQKRWDNGGLAELWAAAKNHPRTSHVFFGGPGGEQAMREQFPNARLFHRYAPGDDILKHATTHGVDQAGIPRRNFSRRLVRKLKEARIRVSTNQINRKRGVRDALRVGIRLMQTDSSRRTVRRWCR
ncbi:MAG: glycerophosphodiester phosphodiesterase [Nocardioides sp.]